MNKKKKKRVKKSAASVLHKLLHKSGEISDPLLFFCPRRLQNVK